MTAGSVDRACVAALAAAVAGCTSLAPDAPVSTPAALAVDGGYAAPLPPGVSGGDTADLTEWWTRFDDPVLTGLVERSVAGNLDLAVAASRLVQAREALVQAETARSPLLRGNVGLGRTGFLTGAPTANIPILVPGGGVGSQAVTAGGQTNIQLGADASYTVDLFGAVRGSIGAAEADLAATALDAGSGAGVGGERGRAQLRHRPRRSGAVADRPRGARGGARQRGDRGLPRPGRPGVGGGRGAGARPGGPAAGDHSPAAAADRPVRQPAGRAGGRGAECHRRRVRPAPADPPSAGDGRGGPSRRPAAPAAGRGGGRAAAGGGEHAGRRGARPALPPVRADGQSDQPGDRAERGAGHHHLRPVRRAHPDAVRRRPPAQPGALAGGGGGGGVRRLSPHDPGLAGGRGERAARSPRGRGAGGGPAPGGGRGAGDGRVRALELPRGLDRFHHAADGREPAADRARRAGAGAGATGRWPAWGCSTPWAAASAGAGAVRQGVAPPAGPLPAPGTAAQPTPSSGQPRPGPQQGPTR